MKHLYLARLGNKIDIFLRSGRGRGRCGIVAPRTGQDIRGIGLRGLATRGPKVALRQERTTSCGRLTCQIGFEGIARVIKTFLWFFNVVQKWNYLKAFLFNYKVNFDLRKIL